jgi:hypothetical protein
LSWETQDLRPESSAVLVNAQTMLIALSSRWLLNATAGNQRPPPTTYTHGDWSRHFAVIDGAAKKGQFPAVLVVVHRVSADVCEVPFYFQNQQPLLYVSSHQQ